MVDAPLDRLTALFGFDGGQVQSVVSGRYSNVAGL